MGMVKEVLSSLKKDGEARLIFNGRDFRFCMNGMEYVEVTEVLANNSQEFIFEAAHDYEIQEWLEDLYEEKSTFPQTFLLCMTSFGEWVSYLYSLAQIAVVIGFSDFNETDNHKVYAINGGIPTEVEWQKNHRNLCVDFGEYGSYGYPDH